MIAKVGRYFLAVSLPDAQKESLRTLQDRGRGFAWTRLENLHLTLRFIGEAETEQIERLIGLLGEMEVAPFILPLEGVGAFPPRSRSRVIWAGVGSAHPRLFQLRKVIDDTLLQMGLDADLKHFHPHVTIARIRDEAKQSAVSEWLKRWAEYQGPPFRVEAIDLYQSFVGQIGSTYEKVARFPLE